jgi:hypothetical protein
VPLLLRLEKEARERFAAGDKAGFLKRLRQAEAAGLKASSLNSFAWRMATAADETMRDPLEAERLARAAIELGGRSAQYLDTLAAARAAQGKYDEALALQLEAIQLAAGTREESSAYANRAILYQNRRPYVTAKKAE